VVTLVRTTVEIDYDKLMQYLRDEISPPENKTDNA